MYWKQTMQDKDFVDICKVSKTYANNKLPAVDKIDLSIARGDFFGLLGPNGAGKTTLLSMICGLLTPSSGNITVSHRSVRELDHDFKHLIGFVPQELALYQTLTAGENLAFFGAMQGLNGTRLKQRIDTCLAITRLESRVNDRVETFSGGLKRRLNLAIGLLHEPELLILDEPTVGIDPQSRNFIFESLRQLNDQGMTLIYTTHYMEEAEQLCNNIAIIDRGKIIARGSLDELLKDSAGHSMVFRTRDPLTQTVIDKIKSYPFVSRITSLNSKTDISIRHDTGGKDSLAEILETIRSAGLDIVSLSMGATNLEQLFLQLTGTQLRD
jgi:ABC-2 type transport system ATP-binding protein